MEVLNRSLVKTTCSILWFPRGYDKSRRQLSPTKISISDVEQTKPNTFGFSQTAVESVPEISAADALARFRFRILNHSAMTAAAFLHFQHGC